MTGKNVIFLLLGLALVFIVIRFVLSLFQDPTDLPGPQAAIVFPICQGSSESAAVLKIQKHLNKNKKSFITPYLKEDGKFGSKTEWELNDQTQAICVTKVMYPGMNNISSYA